MQQVLRESQPALPGSRQLVVSLSMNVAAAEESEPSLLPWLATQPVYPQFYWQHRQEPEEAAVCGWYAGSAGYLSLARAEFCVALRSAEINGDKINLYAGAGILPGSDPEQEWVELDNKAAGLKTLFDGKVS